MVPRFAAYNSAFNTAGKQRWLEEEHPQFACKWSHFLLKSHTSSTWLPCLGRTLTHKHTQRAKLNIILWFLSFRILLLSFNWFDIYIKIPLRVTVTGSNSIHSPFVDMTMENFEATHTDTQQQHQQQPQEKNWNYYCKYVRLPLTKPLDGRWCI